ncbi:MAG: 8-oxo-dGTP diphosphatase [Clostridia bacterium]|nr:8-oxo-dGTP diphosphatase [Clostridia bacterium]
MENVILTNMCMICDGKGRVLVQNRVNPNWPGITFPGGHIEYGESVVDSVIREVKEETGLTVSNLTLCGIEDWMRDSGERYIVFFYKTETFTGELESSREGEVFWVDIEDFPQMKLSDGMKEKYNIFINDSFSEHFYYKENGEWKGVLK